MMIYYDQVGFIAGIERWFSILKLISVIQHINRMEGKNPHDYLHSCRKKLEKCNPLMTETLSILGMEGSYLNTSAFPWK